VVSNRRKPARGFTIVELLLVVVLIMILTLIAYPALRTFSARDKEAGVAANVAQTLNRLKGQARRRGRAYHVRFTFVTDAPGGRMVVREGNSTSCMPLLDNLNDNSRAMYDFSFGLTPGQNFESVGRVHNVGLVGWIPPGGALVDQRSGAMQICIKTNGAVLMYPSLAPISGRARVVVRQFQNDGAGWALAGPPRTVEIPFGGPARLGMD